MLALGDRRWDRRDLRGSKGLSGIVRCTCMGEGWEGTEGMSYIELRHSESYAYDPSRPSMLTFKSILC